MFQYCNRDQESESENIKEASYGLDVHCGIRAPVLTEISCPVLFP